MIVVQNETVDNKMISTLFGISLLKIAQENWFQACFQVLDDESKLRY